MKTLSASQEAVRDTSGHGVVWIVAVHWPSPTGTKYYTNRPGLSIGVTSEPILDVPPRCARSLNLTLSPDIASLSDMFVLRNVHTNANRIETLLEEHEAAGMLVECFMAFEDGDGIVQSDWIPQGARYRVRHAESVGAEARFEIEDELTIFGGKPAARVISDALFPDAPHGSYGLPLPRIIGHVDNCPAVPIGGQRTAQLDGEALPTDTVIRVRELRASEWPATGTLRIGADTATYTAIDESARTFGTTASPVVWSANATAHQDGDTVALVLSEYVYALCDHEAAVSNVRIEGGQALGAGEYTAAMRSAADGSQYQAIALSSLPTIQRLNTFAITSALDNEAAQWADNSSTAGEPTNAIDADEKTKHTSVATLQSSTGKRKLALTYAGNHAGRGGQLVRAKAAVSYYVKPGKDSSSAAIAWGGPEIRVKKGATVIASAPLSKPGDDEFEGLLDDAQIGLHLDDSRPLFQTVGNSAPTDMRPAYQEGYGKTGNLKPGELIDTYVEFWPSLKQSAIDDAIEFTNPLASFTAFGFTGDVFFNVSQWPPAPGGTLAVKAKSGDLPTGNINKIRIRTRVAWSSGSTGIVNGVNFPVLERFITATLRIAGQVKTLRFQAMGNGSIIADLEGFLSGDFTPAQVAAAIVEFKSGVVPGGQWWTGNISLSQWQSALRWNLVSLQIDYYGGFDLVGSTTRLDGTNDPLVDQALVGASRMFTQRLDFTGAIRAAALADEFSYFDGTLSVEVEDVAGPNDTKILVSDVRFELTERAAETVVLDPAQARILADVDGMRTLEDDGAALTVEDCARVIMGDDNLLGWTEDTEWDAASLAAAVPSTGSPGRWISDSVQIRDLLESLCRDFGLWAFWESGQLKFSRRRAPSVDASARAIGYSDLCEGVRITKSTTPIDEVVNRLALSYHRDPSQDGRLTLTMERNDSGSQGLEWGVRRDTTFSDWIHGAIDAEAFLARELPLCAYRWKMARGRLRLNHIDFELCDPATITFSRERIDGAAALIAGLENDGAEIAFTMASRFTRQRFYLDEAETVYYEVTAGNQRINFVIAGVLVAYMDASGNLAIRGGLSFGTPPAATPDANISWDAANEQIVFAARHSDLASGAYYPCASIDADGNLLCDSLIAYGPQFATSPLNPFLNYEFGGIGWTLGPLGHFRDMEYKNDVEGVVTRYGFNQINLDLLAPVAQAGFISIDLVGAPIRSDFTGFRFLDDQATVPTEWASVLVVRQIYVGAIT